MDLWDLTREKRLLHLPHPVAVHAVAFSPEGRLLATGSEDCTIRLWNLLTGVRDPYRLGEHAR